RGEEDFLAAGSEWGANPGATGHDGVGLLTVERDPHQRDLAAGLHRHNGFAISFAEEQLPLAEVRRRDVGLHAALDVPLDARSATRALTRYRIQDVERRPQADRLASLEVKDVGDTSIGHRCMAADHTSELQSPDHLVCRLLLEMKK